MTAGAPASRLLLGVLALTLAACGSTTRGAVECPAGATWNGAVCVGEVACPPGTTLNGGVCSPPVVAAAAAPAPVTSSEPVAAAPAPTTSALPPANAPARVDECGCAPGDLACSMKCSARRNAGTGGSPMMPPASPTAPFDREAAAAALAAAASSAKGCKTPNGPSVSGTVTVVFAPNGVVKSVAVGAPFAGTPVGSCVAGAFRSARVPSFAGPDVSVAKTVAL